MWVCAAVLLGCPSVYVMHPSRKEEFTLNATASRARAASASAFKSVAPRACRASTAFFATSAASACAAKASSSLRRAAAAASAESRALASSTQLTQTEAGAQGQVDRRVKRHSFL